MISKCNVSPGAPSLVILWFSMADFRKWWTFSPKTKTHKKYVTFFFLRTFEGRTPALLVSDPDFLKEVLVKEFHAAGARRVKLCLKYIDYRLCFVQILKNKSFKEKFNNVDNGSFFSPIMNSLPTQGHYLTSLSSMQEVITGGSWGLQCHPHFQRGK